MYLVTGGAGFIGSNLVADLARRGPVAVCDRLGTGGQWRNLAKHPVVEIVHPDDLTDWLADRIDGLSAIFHLGASSSTTEADVDFILRNNLTLSQELWAACTEAGTPFIYASSAATYGDGSQGFADDNDPVAIAALRPLNPYGWSKKLFDLHAVSEAAAGRAPPLWAGLRFFNVYGPNEYHKEDQRSVAVQLYEQIRESGRARLFRSHRPDYPDGGQRRDFVWVGDCSALMLWALDRGESSGVINCGTGEARSFAELAAAVFAAMGREPVIDYVDTPEHIRRHYQYFTEADMGRVRAAGFAAPFTSLEEGVRRYVEEHLATDDRYR